MKRNWGLQWAKWLPAGLAVAVACSDNAVNGPTSADAGEAGNQSSGGTLASSGGTSGSGGRAGSGGHAEAGVVGGNGGSVASDGATETGAPALDARADSGASAGGCTLSSTLTWSARASLLRPRTELGAAVVGGHIYAIGGNDGTSAVADNEEYDPETDRWTSKQPAPTARQRPVVAAVGGKIYVIAGAPDSGVYGQVHDNELYDPSTNTWTTRAPVPPLATLISWSRFDFAQLGYDPNLGGAAIGDKIYMATSVYGTAGPTIVYDTASDAWSPASQPILDSGRPAAAEIGGRLYFITEPISGEGWDNRSAEFDPLTTPSWTIHAGPPVRRSAQAVAASASLLFVLGGYETADPRPDSAAVDAFDPKADRWATLPSAPTARRSAAAAFVDDHLYFIGGKTKGSAVPSNVVEVASCSAGASRVDGGSGAGGSTSSPPASPCKTTSTLSWRTRARLLHPRWEPGAAVVGGRIYVIGGNNGSALADNDEYDPALDRWTAKRPMSNARQWPLVAVVAGKIYVLGGYFTDPGTTTHSLANEVYDPATDTWADLAPVPKTDTGFMNVVGGAALGDKIYAAHAEYSVVDATLVYDTKTDTWSSMAPMPLSGGQPAAAAVAGKLYFITETDLGGDDRVATLEPGLSPPWAIVSDVPTKRTEQAVASSSSLFFVIGGFSTIGSHPDSAAVDAYDPTANAWGTLTNVTTPRVGGAAVVAGDRLYFIGGGLRSMGGALPLPTALVEEGTCSP